MQHSKNVHKISNNGSKMHGNKLGLEMNFDKIFLVYNLFGYNILPLRGFTRVCVNVASVCMALLIFYYVIACSHPENWLPSLLCLLVEYFIIVIHCAIRQTPFNYLGATSIDDILRFGKTEYLKLKHLHISLIVMVIVIKFYIEGIICYFMEQYCTRDTIVGDIFASVLISAVDCYQIPRILYFTSIYFRARLLRKHILASFSPVGSQYDSIVKCAQTPLMLYREFLDGVDAAAPQINLMLMSSLFCSFFKIVCMVYQLLSELGKSDRGDKEGNVIFMTFYATTLILNVVQWLMPWAPGILNEMTCSQLQSLKLSLTNKLLDCGNKEHRKKLQMMVRYMNLRQFNYRVWRLVRIDVTLVLTMLSLSTTYVIVIIQFSSLYY